MTAENPYAPPAARVSDPVVPDVPAKILRKIKTAWIAGIVSGSVTLVFTLLAVLGTSLLGFSVWELVDVALVFGLTLGIYMKSRICAVVMFIYFIVSKIILIAEAGQVAGLPLALVFGYFFWQGISGTFAYHKFKNSTLQP